MHEHMLPLPARGHLNLPSFPFASHHSCVSAAGPYLMAVRARARARVCVCVCARAYVYVCVYVLGGQGRVCCKNAGLQNCTSEA